MDKYVLKNNYKVSTCPPGSLKYRITATKWILLRGIIVLYFLRCNVTINCFSIYYSPFFYISFQFSSQCAFWLFPGFANTKAIPVSQLPRSFLRLHVFWSFSHVHCRQWSWRVISARLDQARHPLCPLLPATYELPWLHYYHLGQLGLP